MADTETANSSDSKKGNVGDYVKKHKGVFIVIGIVSVVLVILYLRSSGGSGSNYSNGDGTTASPNTIAVPGPQGPTGPRGFRGAPGKTRKKKKKKSSSNHAEITSGGGSTMSPAHLGNHSAGLPAIPNHATFPVHNPRALATGRK
jgi:hypothetical protein